MNRTLACAGAIALLALPLSLKAQQDQAPPPPPPPPQYQGPPPQYDQNPRLTHGAATQITTPKLAYMATCSA